MQIYQDLRVLTARPNEAEMQLVPHHLYGVRDGAEPCSAGLWAQQAVILIKDLQARGKKAILVGGTGLYFRTLIEGLSPIPAVPDKVRQAAKAREHVLGVAAFREEVLGFDPAMTKLAVNDRQRLMRAWEVFTATGTALSVFQALPRVPLYSGPTRKLCLMPPREQVYAKCDARFEMMLTQGALTEVQALMTRELDPALPIMKSLGVAPLAAYLAGALSREEASMQAMTLTRRFAKRQMTWFRGQMPDWEVISGPLEG